MANETSKTFPGFTGGEPARYKRKPDHKTHDKAALPFPKPRLEAMDEDDPNKFHDELVKTCMRLCVAPNRSCTPGATFGEPDEDPGEIAVFRTGQCAQECLFGTDGTEPSLLEIAIRELVERIESESALTAD